LTEPVAFYDPHKGFYWAKPTKITAPVTVDVEPLALYTQRTWVGLTGAEIEGAIDDGFAFGLNDGNVSNDCVIRYVRVIEAKLKEKNS